MCLGRGQLSRVKLRLSGLCDKRLYLLIPVTSPEINFLDCVWWLIPVVQPLGD